MAFFAFLGIAYTQREGGHIRMDILVSHLHGRRLWFVEFFSTLLMLIVTLVLIYGSFLHFYAPIKSVIPRSTSISRPGLPNWLSRSHRQCWPCAWSCSAGDTRAE
jgi:C4-dicarboxylate transporter DctQ subunit